MRSFWNSLFADVFPPPIHGTASVMLPYACCVLGTGSMSISAVVVVLHGENGTFVPRKGGMYDA